MSVRFGLALAALLGVAGVEAAQHEGLAAVRDRGYLRICADPDNLPFSSRDPATRGFEVELADLVARELGVQPRFEWHSTYQRALRPLRDGACEMFMGLPGDPRFREGNPWIVVSRPYYTMIHAIVAPAAAGYTAVADLRGRRVAVELASVAEFHVAYRDVDRGLYRTQAEAFQAMRDGQAVAAFLWLPVAAWLARGHADLRVVPVSDGALQFAIGAGVRKRDPGLAGAVDAAIGRLVEDGRVRGILSRYGALPAPRARLAGDDIVLAQAKDPVDSGRSIFSTACSRCHGADGSGGGTGGSIPVLRNYDGGQDKFMRIVMQGRKNTAMAGFRGILTEQEAMNVYRYLTSLPRQ